MSHKWSLEQNLMGYLSQKKKFERIRNAYINGTFTLEEYNDLRKTVEDTINDLEVKIKDNEVCEELGFSIKDILNNRKIIQEKKKLN